jgi:hypothetical protein
MEKQVWTDEAVGPIARSIADLIGALIDGDDDGFQAKANQANQMMENPKNTRIVTEDSGGAR